jgi:hypothetical protein
LRRRDGELARDSVMTTDTKALIRLQRVADGQADCESHYGNLDAFRADLRTLLALARRVPELEEALQRIIDQPDTHPSIGGRWIDWAKGRAKQALYSRAALSPSTDQTTEGEARPGTVDEAPPLATSQKASIVAEAVTYAKMKLEQEFALKGDLHTLSRLVNVQPRTLAQIYDKIAPLAAAVPSEDPIGCAEREVGRWVYRRIEVLMDAKPGVGTTEAQELGYLADVVVDVEEYGATGEHPVDGLPPSPSKPEGETGLQRLIEAALEFGDPGWANTWPSDAATADLHNAAMAYAETVRGAVG